MSCYKEGIFLLQFSSCLDDLLLNFYCLMCLLDLLSGLVHSPLPTSGRHGKDKVLAVVALIFLPLKIIL